MWMNALCQMQFLEKNFNQMRPSWLLLLGFDPRVIDIDQFTKSSNAKSVFFSFIWWQFFFKKSNKWFFWVFSIANSQKKN
jgi:hypothetical protein